MPKKEDNVVLLTPEGLKNLKEELQGLKEVRRPEIAEKIKIAIEYGDLSENAEYDEAKNDQALLEARILELESMIKYAQIIDESQVKGNKVIIGSTITLYNDKDESTDHYTIVGSIEADPLNGRISNESPVGRAILNKKKGEVCEVKTPSGMIRYTIKNIKHK